MEPQAASDFYKYLFQRIEAVKLRVYNTVIHDSNYDIIVLNEYNVTIKSQAVSKNILVLEQNSTGCFLKGTINSTSPPAGSTFCVTFENVRYRNATETTIQEGTLHVYKTSSGVFGVFKGVSGAGKLVYKSDFATHLTDVAGFTQQRGVIGGHNLFNFESYLMTNSIEINRLSTLNGPFDGLVELLYQIKKADGSSGWKATIFKKTVYDPAKIADVQVIQFGKEAMEEGISSGRTVLQTGSNTIIKGEAANGMKFLGYQNPTTGEILNFHPVINW